jgi:hypothetical protein
VSLLARNSRDSSGHSAGKSELRRNRHDIDAGENHGAGEGSRCTEHSSARPRLAGPHAELSASTNQPYFNAAWSDPGPGRYARARRACGILFGSLWRSAAPAAALWMPICVAITDFSQAGSPGAFHLCTPMFPGEQTLERRLGRLTRTPARSFQQIAVPGGAPTGAAPFSTQSGSRKHDGEENLPRLMSLRCSRL